MMFVTAYGALIEDAKVGKGDFVLISAASSSVGLAAIQIANYAGATSIALTRNISQKEAVTAKRAAAHVIATDEVDLVRTLTRPKHKLLISHCYVCEGGMVMVQAD